MGLVLVEGLDGYAATSDLLKGPWPAGGGTLWNFNASAGRNGGGAITSTATALTLKSPINLWPGAASQIGLYFGLWLKISAPPSAETALITTLNSADAGSASL